MENTRKKKTPPKQGGGICRFEASSGLTGERFFPSPCAAGFQYLKNRAVP